MSIAALSSAFAAQVRRSASSGTAPAVESIEPVRSAPRIAREQGRRHELVAAMNQALGVQPSTQTDKHADQAVFRFAHALMHDLRTMVGEESDGPRAWGRRDWGDLSQRLSALATAAGGVAAEAPAPEVPDQPDPLTATTAAVHIMKVPSSHLLAAFVAMQRALGLEADAQGDDADAFDEALAADDDAARAALAELARRLASSLAPASGATLPAGAVVNLSA